jgi:hypothetical protein
LQISKKRRAPRERGSEKEEKMNHTKNAIMITIFSSTCQGENHYTKTSISKLAFTIKGIKYLVSKRVVGAWKMLKSMLAWLKKGDARWPEKKDVQGSSYWPEGADEKQRLKGLLGIVGKKI